MTKSNHTHRLKKKSYKSGNAVYFCTLPDCFFKIAVEFSLGKTCLCWRCGEPFSMNAYSMRLVKPHCENCHRLSPLKVDDDTSSERRQIPTRRELDPTVLAVNTEQTLETLKEKLSGSAVFKTIPESNPTDEDDVEL